MEGEGTGGETRRNGRNRRVEEKEPGESKGGRMNIRVELEERRRRKRAMEG